MSIEEATEILNEVIITEPSIKSYNYISAEDINFAIEKIITELDKKEKEIENLRYNNATDRYKTKFYGTKLSYVNCKL